jgi:hypothetical protein
VEELGFRKGKIYPNNLDSRDEFKRDDHIPMSWTHAYRDDVPQDGYSLGWLSGRLFIKPLPKSKSGFGDFIEEPAYCDFIVGIDANGNAYVSPVTQISGMIIMVKIQMLHFSSLLSISASRF